MFGFLAPLAACFASIAAAVVFIRSTSSAAVELKLAWVMLATILDIVKRDEKLSAFQAFDFSYFIFLERLLYILSEREVIKKKI